MLLLYEMEGVGGGSGNLGRINEYHSDSVTLCKVRLLEWNHLGGFQLCSNIILKHGICAGDGKKKVLRQQNGTKIGTEDFGVEIKNESVFKGVTK